MKQINILYYNNSNIEALTSKIIITIIVKTIKIIKKSGEKNIKKLTKKQARTRTKIIIINNIIIA